MPSARMAVLYSILFDKIDKLMSIPIGAQEPVWIVTVFAMHFMISHNILYL